MFKKDNYKFEQYTIARSGYLLFKFSPIFMQNGEDSTSEYMHNAMEIRDPQIFILGTQDINSLLQIQPQKSIEKGMPEDESKSEMVYMVNHKRSFDSVLDQMDQCILTVKQKGGFIHEFFPGQAEDDEEPTANDWYYEFTFHLVTPKGEV